MLLVIYCAFSRLLSAMHADSSLQFGSAAVVQRVEEK